MLSMEQVVGIAPRSWNNDTAHIRDRAYRVRRTLQLRHKSQTDKLSKADTLWA